MRGAIGSAFISKDTEICTRYQEIFIRLGHHPSTEEEMVELETFLGQSTDLLSALNSELNEVRARPRPRGPAAATPARRHRPRSGPRRARSL